MKTKTILLIAFVFGLLSTPLFATTINKAKCLFKNKIDSPPGTVAITDHFFYDQAEASNFNWQEFVYWNKSKYGENSTEYKAAFPDTSVWGKQFKPFAEHYYTHPAFRNYPVVGVSYEQVLAYCEWRSNRVNEMLYLKKHKLKYHPDSIYVNVPQLYTYRLPTESEWKMMANIGYSKKALRHKMTMGNFNHPAKNESSADTNFAITAPVESYWPNVYGIYNLYGNIAEMIIEKGKAKGGSWATIESESKINQTQLYTKAENWLGFRCVCEKN